ncbi:MAG: exodeoxyribonuclease V subunit gamma, partial [Clostridia bacterium]|nr:exodeoxyribonuclease V subunit gamma [Clostridia bacterium]
MLNLIISRTGYGKTTYIKSKIKELVEQNEQLVLIIPEQISFESERDILREVGAKNLKNVTVMSFTRLCSIFFAQYGGREKPYIDTVGKTALMAQVLKSNENKLDLFKKASKTSQFCEMMLKLHNNLKKISVTPEDLFSCASAEKGLLSGKLSESSLILSEYEKELNKEYFDPLDDLSVVTERLDENPFFENKIVFIDSFTGFTTQQIKLIEKIMKSAKQTYISLGFDGVYSTNGLSCFSNMAKTALQLKQLAKDNGVQVGDDIIFTKNHRFKNDELDFLEKNIFADDKNVYDESVENIFVTSVKNIYEEVEYVAKTIIDLTRKQGLRYREISVISRDANAYNQVINEVFEKYEIPLFVDDREGVENLNLFKLVYFALQAVCKKFDNESVISLVKTGLAGVSDTEAELFELYTYVWRVNKKDFFEEFKLPIDSFITGDDEYKETITKTIEETRQKIIAPLEKFKKQKGKTIKSFVTAIYQLIEDYDCGVTLKKQAEKLKENGYLRLSESTVRSYDIMIHILDQLYLSLGETQVDTKGFFDIFNSAVALLDVGSLPQGIDAVAVGSAERMRPKSPRVTFIIGANEGVFPSASSGKGLFADSELLTLKEKGINLPFFDVDTAVDEQYLAYCAVCSPSEKLFISYPEFSLSGEQKAPSVIVDNILDIFEKLQVVKYDNTEIRSAEDAIKAFAISGATDVEIAQYFNENNNIKFENLMQSRTDKISKISQQTAKELYGDTIYSSASKVEAYNKCSFYYFCQYGLEAKVLKQAKIDALSRGSLVHFILEKMLNTYSVDEFFALSQMQIFEKIKEFADEFWNKNSSAVNQTLVEKYRFSKLCEMVEELVLRVYEELKQSEFNVVKNELAFGGEEPDIKALEVDFEDGKIALIGKIDRVDKSVKNGKQILRIIDYKTGNKKLDFADLIYGQNLQMPIYMKAVIDNGKDEFGECLPGGMFYFAARESVAKMSKNSTDEEIVAERLKSVKMDGTFLGEEDVYTAIEPDGKGYYSPVKVNKDNTLS